MENWETGWNRDVLERIVVLLFALAGLADRAAGLPFLRRRQLLGILSNGEAEARAFVIGMVCDASVPADALEQTGDAERLAVRLRALALLLCVLLTRRAALSGAADPCACRPSHDIFGLAFRMEALAPPVADTS